MNINVGKHEICPLRKGRPWFRLLQNLQNMQTVQNMQNIQIMLRPALISRSSGSSCRTSSSSSAHPPLAIFVSREEELQLLASPGNRVAKVVIDQLGQLVWLVVVFMFMLIFVLICDECVVRFLNPVTPTSIVPLTMFLSNLMYTWTAKKTSVSLWKKGFLTHTGPSPCLPLRRCRGPCFQTCASRSRQLGRVRPVARARWGQSLKGKINKFQVEEKKKWGSDYSFSSEDASKAKPTGSRSWD